MNQLLIALYILFLPALYGFTLQKVIVPPDSFSSVKIIIAKVAGKEISLDDFIRRAEYTIRPVYCRGDLNSDKMIVLNSLIAEKLFAIEAGNDNDLVRNSNFLNYINGRKEQKMRELLRFVEGKNKVETDTNDIKRIYSVAGRTYKIQYFNIADLDSAYKLFGQYKNEDSSFYKIYKNISDLDTVPSREVKWESKENLKIHDALFSSRLSKGAMLGPISVDDTMNIFINILGWSDRIALTGQDIESRLNDVKEYLTDRIADSLYDEFVYSVMRNKKVEFDVDVFNKLTGVAAKVYFTARKEDEDAFMDMAYKGNAENLEISNADPLYDDIKDLPLLKIEDIKDPSAGVIWTVSDLVNEIRKHPLVFRKQNIRDKFANQFRLAIVDLIRDIYLTETAYERGLDKNEIVTRYTEAWHDAAMAMFQTSEYLKSIGADRNVSVESIEKNLNPYVESLFKKYSRQIEINVEEFEKITLSRIDMFTTEDNVPYKIYVPAFPQITTYRRLDYGNRMMN